MKNARIPLLLIAALLVFSIPACVNEQVSPGGLSLDENALTARVSGGTATVFLPLRPNDNYRFTARAQVWIRDLGGNLLGQAETYESLRGSAEAVEVQVAGLPAVISAEELADYVIDYRVSWSNGAVSGRRSLFMAAPKAQTVLLGPDRLIAGAENHYRLIARDPGSGKPLPGAVATFKLVWSETVEGEEEPVERSIELFTGQTDELGTLAAEFLAPEEMAGGAEVRVTLASDDLQEDNLAAPIQVERLQKILLTTDKPIYQPGQTIHIRSLTLRRPSLAPEAGAEVTLEVSDSKGNKVFKAIEHNDEYGIASATFRLASEVLMGTYSVKAILGDTVSEKAVTVDRYALPKFKVGLTTNKDFYRPGETLTGSIEARYFFGKAVNGADVAITARKFDLEFVDFQLITGKTDAEGRYDFSLQLPSYFVGQPLDQGAAFVLLHVEVTDTAQHTEKLEKTRPVVQAAVVPQMVPESGDVVPDMENVFYLLTSDPQGRPLAAQSTVSLPGGESVQVVSGESGITTFSMLAPSTGDLELEVHSVDGGGNDAHQTFNFAPGANGALVLLRTDRPVYEVGDTAEIEVFCPRQELAALAFKDRVYLDAIKDGRTVLMTTVELDGGQGRYSLDLTPDLAGGFELEAYYLNADSTIMRDRKLVYVDPADQLRIGITPDKDIFAPAETARLTFSITDADGAGVPSAIGLQVVDEAVFALMEFRPGLEKVFYALEEDILNPQYQINGYGWNDVVQGDPDDGMRDEAAAVLFAASGDKGFGVNIDTFSGLVEAVVKRTQAQLEADVETLRERFETMYNAGIITSFEDAMAYLESNKHRWIDPWGTPYSMELNYSQLRVASAGPDERFGTDDDLSAQYYLYGDFSNATKNGGQDRDGEWADPGFNGDVDDDALAGGGDPPGECAGGECGSPDESGGGGHGSQPRIRNYFPETLYVNPALITDSNGVAELELPLADSITTWRMTALASSASGLLGSTQSGITVFQDFFVDIDFPATLTQDDEISVPIAIYNYLEVPQTVTLSVELGDWFELLDAADKTIELGAGEVLGEYFRIKVRDVGWHSFTVFGYGTELSDAIGRTIEVVPNGKEILDSVSARLEGSVEHTISIPEAAIDGASKVLVKIYPGIFSQAVEGLDSILRMPSGCFEQTSSATYPNVMVLNYMMATEQITPEIELKAREYVNQGYQRLLTYECDGGGFDWFGKTPAHNILTAYGLLEFYDMAKVHPVDPAIITRTQQWLVDQQQGDGHFDPTHGGIREGAINNLEDDVARTSAYLTYALVETGYTGPAAARAVGWLKQHASEVDDNYGMAMFANALIAYQSTDSVGRDMLRRLHEAREEDGSKIFWSGTGESTTYGSGDVMTIETTALVAYAMIRAGQYPEDVDGALNYLVGNKDSFGTWQTTQATILTLRAMLASMEQSASPGAAVVRVYAGGELYETLDIDEATSDVLRLVDLSDVTIEGDNAIKIEIDGEASYMYQVVGKYYMPWGGEGGQPNQGMLSIDVEYDKTTLEVDDIASATVTVTNNTPDSMAKMVILDIGLPPGFDLLDDDLRAAVEAGVLQKFEKTERQIIVYVEQISYGEPLVITYQIQARFPIKGSSGESEAHPYYDPDNSTQDEPTEFEVTG